MAVYVDTSRTPYKGMLMCHMMADCPNELRAMARRIGVDEKWVQYPGTPREHFDICATKRVKAVQGGALSVSPKILGRLIRHKRDGSPHPFAT